MNPLKAQELLENLECGYFCNDTGLTRMEYLVLHTFIVKYHDEALDSRFKKKQNWDGSNS